MRNHRLLPAFCVFATLLMGCFVTQAHDFEVDGIYYNINADGTTVSVTYKGSSAYDFDEYSGEVTIPDRVTFEDVTYSVTSIGDEAFSGCRGLTDVEIPGSVTTIGSYAFSFCDSLSRVTIPGSATSIRYGAFYYCNSLSSVTIPNSVRSIGDGAFGHCRGLTSIIVEEGNPAYDMRDNCNGIVETASNTLIAGCVNTVIPNTVTSIRYAFLGCSGLTDIDIPSSVTVIGPDAFSYCTGLTHIAIPSSVTSIGDEAFSGCRGLTDVEIPGSVTTIGSYAFSFCDSLSRVTIPSSVTSIRYGAFYYCKNLANVTSLAMTPPVMQSSDCFSEETYADASLQVPLAAIEVYRSTDYWNRFYNIVSGETFEVDGIYYRVISENTVCVIHREGGYRGQITIPESVNHENVNFGVVGIEAKAFDGCVELTSVVIGDAVEIIGKAAFQGCVALTSVEIGSSVNLIKEMAFGDCDALTLVKCRGLMPPVMAGSNCFTSTAYSNATLRMPHDAVSAYSSADYWYLFNTIRGYGTAGPGDVDGDGVVNIQDVTRLIDFLLDVNSGDFYIESADLNGNGRIDIADVTTLIDNLLNGDY